jgi:hypothetical protein
MFVITMANQPQTMIDDTASSNTVLTEQEKKYGKSIFKKWIYAKFDAKLILEIVQKDIYFNPKLSLLVPDKNPGKNKFLTTTLDLKGLRYLQKEVSEAIAELEKLIPKKEVPPSE